MILPAKSQPERLLPPRHILSHNRKEVAAVIPGLLWIVGIYAAAAVWAHWAYRISAGASRRHYVLVAGNEQLQIEGYVRALQRFSRRTGTEIGITVVLDHSSDETGAIVEKFARGDSGIDWMRREDEEAKLTLHHWERSREASPEEASGQIVWVDLGCREHIARLPMWRRW
jgi:hypothetical protein